MTHTLESLKKILDDPSMMIVPIDQWNALNKELGDLRNRKSQRRIATQQWYETDTTKTGWDSHGWMFEDGEMTDGWELEDILHQDKFGNIWKATFVKSQANPWGTIASTLDPAAEYKPNWKGTAPIGATYYLLEIYSLLITGPHTKGVLDVFLHQFHMEFPTMEAAQKEADMMKQYRAPARNTEEIKKGWDEFSIAMYRKAVEDIGWKFTSNEASARDQLSKEPFTSLAKYYKDTHPPIGLGNGLIEDLTSRKPYTFLVLPAAEIMVGIKSGQTWSNGYYTSSGCNEIGIYFDHKFGTTSVPWELVAEFIEENKIWEKL